MAEQFLRAWSINLEDLYKEVGSNNKAFVEKSRKVDVAEEINDLIQEWGDYSLEEALNDICTNNLSLERDYEYMRALEVILKFKAHTYMEEITLPGRGWQDIGELFNDLNMPVFHKLWNDKRLLFPWSSEEKKETLCWPVGMVLERNLIKALKAEMENFDSELLKNKALPERINDLDEFTETFLSWLENDEKDLILILDGQQ